MADETAAPKRLKHRSPSYPAFDLETTLHRAQQLSSLAGRHSAPMSAALSTFGYSPKSSMGSLTVAALRKYGLADIQGKFGSRELGLTNLGYELVFYSSDRNSEEWKSRAREAALAPGIHAHLWAKYKGELPADAAILPYLVLDLKFGDSAAAELLKQFRRTVAFAHLTDTDADAMVSEDADEGVDENETADEPLMPPASIAPDHTPSSTGVADAPRADGSKPQAKQRTVQLPYSRSEWALLQAKFPMSDAEWDQMLAVLEAMKPSLVASDE